MPRTTDVFEVGLRITGNPEDAKKIAQNIAPAIEKFQSDFSKAVAKVAKGLGDDLVETTTKFSKGFASPDQIQRMEKAFYKGTEPIWKALEKAKKIEKALQKDLSEDKKKDLQRRLEDLKKYSQNYENTFKQIAKREMDKDLAVFERKKKLAEDYNEWFAKSFADKTEDVVEGIGKGIRDVVGLNLKDALRGGGGLLSKLGAGAMESGRLSKQSAQAAGGSGGMGKAMELLGSVVGKLGTAVSVIGGLAGGVAALFKTLIDADSQAKEFNREIIKASGAMDVMGKSGSNLSDRLHEIRASASAATSALQVGIKGALQFGVTTKEYLETLNKFGEVGVTLDTMSSDLTKTSQGFDGYTKYVSRAATFSRMFGEDLGTMAGHMGEYMKDLGMNLDEVSQGFAVIADEAQKSGFGTKRFFNMVLQATSGVSMYNVRLAGTAKLLTQLGRILGAKMGGDFLKDLTSKITGESYQDRTKRILTTGTDLSKKVITADAERQAAIMKKSLAGVKLDETGMTKGAAEAAKAIATQSDAELVKTLSKVSNEDRRSLTENLSKSDEGAARRLEGLFKLSKAANGNMKDMVEGIGYLGAGSKLVMELEKMRQVTGKSLSDMTLVEKMAYQSQTGLSTEQIDQLQRVQDAALGQLTNAKELAKAVKNKDITLEEANEKLKDSNLKLNSDGEIRSRSSDKVIKDGNDAMINWEESNAKEEKDILTKQEQFSKEVAENTYDLTNILSDSILDVMNRIADITDEILTLLGIKGDKSGMKGTILEQKQEAKAEAEGYQRQIEKLQQAGKSLKLAAETGTPEQKEAAQKALDANKQQIEELRTKRQEAKERGGRFSGFASTASEDQIKAYNLLTSSGGVKGTAALEAVSKATPEELQKLIAAEPTTMQRAMESAAAPEGGFDPTYKTLDDTYKETLNGFAESHKLDETNNKDTKTIKEKTEKLLTDSEKQTKLLEDQAKQADREQTLKALKAAGFTDEELIEATQASKVGGAEFGTAMQRLKRLNEAKFETSGAKVNVEDALVRADGTIIKGGKGDAVAFINEEALRGGGGKGRVGGSANVVFNINATEGREDIVTDKVIAGLHQIYNVMTGDNVAIGA